MTTDSHGDVVETKCLRDVHGDQVVSRTVTDRFGDSRKTTTTGHVRDPRFLMGEKTRVMRTCSGSPIRRIRDDLLVDEGKSRESAASRIDLLNSKGEYLDDPMWRRTASYTDDHVINRSGDRYLEDPWWTRGTRYLDDPLPRSQTYMDEAKWRRASLYSDLVKRDVDDPLWRKTEYPAHLGGRRLI